MTFGERLVYYRERAGLRQKELAQALNITPTRLNYWEKDKREPDLKMFEAICKTLRVDGDVLLGRKSEDEPIDRENSVTPNEFEMLIKKYRQLDPDGQTAVRNVLNHESERVQTIRELEKRAAAAEAKAEDDLNPEMYRYPYLHRIACAGTGFLFDDIPTDTICVPYMRGADFVIGVNGDSMDPTYYDGDLLYIKKTNTLKIGDIGIFTIRNECYVKEYGEHGLISHNKKYNDIPGNEDIRIIGKVIGKVPE